MYFILRRYVSTEELDLSLLFYQKFYFDLNLALDSLLCIVKV